MSEFKKGDRVEYVGNRRADFVTTSLIGSFGTVGTRDRLSADSVAVTWDGDNFVDSVLALNVRKVEPEPEPLKEGDAVLVWAKVLDPVPDPEGEVRVELQRHGYSGDTHTLPDAIVRPDEGQVPPWEKAAQCASLVATGDGSLRRCERNEHGHEMSHLLCGFGSWITADEAGRITEGGAA